MSDHGWQSILRTDATPRARLRGAIFTTYDRPDERLLVEHLLPELLRLDRSAEGDESERKLFFADLVRRLEELQRRLVIVSSMPESDDGGSRAYPWLWRFVHSLHVGRTGAATQHAKLWLLHWSGVDEEADQLEIVVSSTNLTRAALRDQLQAVWRTIVPLVRTPSIARLRGWGILPTFLEKLADSTGGKDHTEYFRALLARAVCPDGVTFLASIPGNHERAELRRSPWGSAGLEGVAPSGNGRTRIRLTAPYVGTWSHDDLASWCRRSGGEPQTLELLWLDEQHPWARQGEQPRWLLPKATHAALVNAKSRLLRLDPTTRFHSEHRGSNDPRWSHAKIYHLRRGRVERLILTSANFSRAAWGATTKAGGLRIENFEFGVCLEKASWPLEHLEPFDHADDAFTVERAPPRSKPVLAWVDAAWDGREVVVRCRVRSQEPPDAEVRSSGSEQHAPVPAWKREGQGISIGRLQWKDGRHPPVSVCVSIDDESGEFGVRDLRPPQELKESPLPEVDEEDSAALRDEMLLEEYGGHLADSDDVLDERVADGDAEVESCNEEGVGGAAADYSLPAFVQARGLFEIVDEWADRVDRAITTKEPHALRAHLKVDGEGLIRALERRANGAAKSALALGPQLAAEELRWRLAAVGPKLEKRDV